MSISNKLIIFDLDGLLVDTEKLFYQALKKVCERNRIGKIKFRDYVDSVVLKGESLQKILSIKDHEIAKFYIQLNSEYMNKLRKEIPLMPHAKECLELFRGNFRVLVTGSKEEHCEYIITKLGLKKYFERVINRDSGFPLKPDSAIFDHLLEYYGKNNKDCLVIEDSRRGIIAASALGIKCIYVPNEYTSHDKVENKYAVTIKSLADIGTAVDSIFPQQTEVPRVEWANFHQEHLSDLRYLFSVYRDIYGLETFTHTDTVNGKGSFEYAKKRFMFVIFALYTPDKKLYSQRSFETGHLTTMLPGGSIDIRKQETIFDAITNCASSAALKNIKIADITPVLLLENNFKYYDDENKKVNIVTHQGIGIRAQLIVNENDIHRYNSDINVKGVFVDIDESSEILQPPNNQVYLKFKEWLSNNDVSSHINEIVEQRDNLARYAMHRRYVKPMFEFLSKYMGECSIKESKNHILKLIGRVNRCIDVSCGDDENIFNFLDAASYVIANDISIDQIANLEQKYKSMKAEGKLQGSMIFTCHDCLNMPFRDNAFDVALCRNTLHHFAQDELEKLFNNMNRIARRIIIIEPDDPAKVSTIMGKLRHYYYINILRDQAVKFYDRGCFEKMILDKFSKTHTVEFDYKKTIRCGYMYAHIQSH